MGRRLLAVASLGLALCAGAVAAPGQTARARAVRLAPSSALRIATPRAGATRWCGAQPSAADRVPDELGGAQIHVVYAFPTGGTDRLAALAGPIATDIEAIDAWWRREDPTRAPRFDLFPFAACESHFGQLDLSRVQLPHDASFYAVRFGRFERIAADVGAASQSLVTSAKKFLIYYDGPADEPRICGESPVFPISGGIQASSIVYIQSCLGSDLGTGGFTALATTHELVHNLGALASPGPPHACPGDAGHPCDSTDDLLYPVGHGQALAAVYLDVGRDDYYGHSGTWWDVQDSPWLTHLDLAQVPVAVAFAGSGSGSVVSDVPGIACPGGCSSSFDAGSFVTLTARASVSSRFAGWSGACTGRDQCSVTLAAAAQVTATFVAQAALIVAVVRKGGSGTVTSAPAGIACAATCTARFDVGGVVALRAHARAGSRFAGWTGACTGTGRCSVRLSRARTVRAMFRKA